MNNPVAAGGVVAWVDSDRVEDVLNVASREGTYGCHVPLVFASDLEACQQQLASVQALHRNAVDNANAAQAEADRLRVEVEEARRHGGRFVLRAEAAEMDADRLTALLNFVPIGELNDWLDADMERYERAPTLEEFRAAIDTAIHAAKTEQERGE